MTLTPDERQGFLRLFVDVLERASVSKVYPDGGQRVRHVGELIEGDRATVRARVLTRQGTGVPGETKMPRRGGRRLVYQELTGACRRSARSDGAL